MLKEQCLNSCRDSLYFLVEKLVLLSLDGVDDKNDQAGHITHLTTHLSCDRIGGLEPSSAPAWLTLFWWAGVNIAVLFEKLFRSGEGAGMLFLLMISGGIPAVLVFVISVVSWPMHAT